MGHTVALTVSHRPLNSEAQVQTQASPCGICGEQSGTGTSFFFEYFSFPLSVLFHQYQCYIIIHSSVSGITQHQHLISPLHNALKSVSVRHKNTHYMIRCQLFKDPLQTHSDFSTYCIISFHGYRAEKHANICQKMQTEVIYTEYTQKNGAVSKVNKKFISHLTRAQRTPPAAATVQVSHALITILQCVHPGSHDTHPHSNQIHPRFGVACPL